MKVKPGDVLLWTGDSALDDVVRLGTLSSFDHVGMVQPEGLTIEALPGGVQANPLAGRLPCLVVSRGNGSWPQGVAAFVKATVGEPYSYLNDLMAALQLPAVTDTEWECAQLTLKLLRLLGEQPPADLPNTPQAVFQWLMFQGYTMQYITALEN